ncbi:lysosomal acid glucosylceramidase-like [Contarinia nasturtii]|uniref:lysosomal acid glucosylceramidase-like n=1 Tax=Contarinia nasturtii TaxID=265458 RepID=UPI0012D3E737|nr:lysosomal acid glucosylceramidase-like [Contarinia nasturtii]
MKKELVLLCAFIYLATALNTSYPCKLVKVEYGYNCECTESFCDTLNIPEPKLGFIFVTSSESGYRFSYKHGEFSLYNSFDKANVLVIDQTIKHEKSKIVGFGGAFTGTVSYILEQFSPKLRQLFYNAYYSKDTGIGYNLLRVPIGGTDFDLTAWTYDNVNETDTALLYFKTLDKRDIVRNQQIKQLQKVSGNDDIKLVSASWLAPLWMKAGQKMDGYAENCIIPEFYETWANLHIKWLKLMEDDGVMIWCLSTGNEPDFMKIMGNEWLLTSWIAGDQSDWFVKYLVPALKKSGNSNIKIQIFDDMRNSSLEYLDEMTARHNDLMQYTDFIAIHGYFDGVSSPEILGELQAKYDKQILYTEMCFGLFEGVRAGAWSRAEEMIATLMGALQHNVAAYIDWNLMLNSTGGPSYVQQLDAPIITNEDYSAFYKQPMYFAMAHFSKFIAPGSFRINSTLLGLNETQVRTVAYLRPDNKVCIVLVNSLEEPISLTLVDGLKGETKLQLIPKSINTLIY